MNELDSVNLYVCGPTVYSEPHIGHARTYITVDLITRTMRDLHNMNIKLVMNITDIDDKIINQAKVEQLPFTAVSKKYEELFYKSLSKLNIGFPSIIVRVSEVVPEIIGYIQQIIDNGFAYPTDDGSVYFDSTTYEAAGYHFSDIESDYHVDEVAKHIDDKRNVRDFALWKGRGLDDIGFYATFKYNGISSESYGRPGWHIECSTMIHKEIGSKLDIHLGGIDLKFPHHHNEKLQANAYYHPLYKVDNWCEKFMHIGHLAIGGCKMSRSLKNFITIDQALKELTPNQMRLMFATHDWQIL